MTIKFHAKNILMQRKLFRNLQPYIYMLRKPIKLYEFGELLSGVNFNKDDIIVDVGCGGGYQTAILKKKCGKIIGIDPNPKAIANCLAILPPNDNNINFICGHLQDANIMGNSIDKVFSICVIEHIIDYEKVFEEVFHILKHKGLFLFSVDCLETITEKAILSQHKIDNHVIHYFNKSIIKTSLERAGFKNIIIYPILKSQIAKRFFIKCIKRNNWKGSLLTYFLLKYCDKKYDFSAKGIFLIVKCEK